MIIKIGRFSNNNTNRVGARWHLEKEIISIRMLRTKPNCLKVTIQRLLFNYSSICYLTYLKTFIYHEKFGDRICRHQPLYLQTQDIQKEDLSLDIILKVSLLRRKSPKWQFDQYRFKNGMKDGKIRPLIRILYMFDTYMAKEREG